jgi:hypothetical protein
MSALLAEFILLDSPPDLLAGALTPRYDSAIGASNVPTGLRAGGSGFLGFIERR